MTDVNGQVSQGLGPVADQFASIAATGQLGEGGAAYSVWHEGVRVVDLWTGMAAPGRPWEHGTRNAWMSVSKAMTAVVCQMAFDRGLYELDVPVATYWPQFGQAGKEAVTVRQVLSHTSGVLGSAEISALIDLEEGIGLHLVDDILDALTRATPLWEPGTQTGYHCFTYSWIMGEIVRRVTGRSLGTFFREEVAEPLGVPGARIGTPAEHHDGIATIMDPMYPAGTPEIVEQYTETLLATGRDEAQPGGMAFAASNGRSALDVLPRIFNRPEGLEPELGGSNLTATASDVAKIMAALVEPDGIDGATLASSASLKTFSEVSTDQQDLVLHLPINRALGYWRNIPVPGRPQACGPNAETVLHTGMGGQLAFADPVARVGGAFTRNHYTHFQIEGLLLNTALYGCLS